MLLLDCDLNNENPFVLKESRIIKFKLEFSMNNWIQGVKSQCCSTSFKFISLERIMKQNFFKVNWWRI